MADSKHYYGGLHGVPWQELNPRFMNDKTPPGWYVGCDLDLERYEILCEDWKHIQGYGETDAAEQAQVRKMLEDAQKRFDAEEPLYPILKQLR